MTRAREILGCALLALGSTTCSSFYNVKLAPVAETQEHLVASVTVPSVGRAQQRMDRLTGPLGLQLPLLAMLTGLQGELPLSLVDRDRPIGIGMVAHQGDKGRALAVATALHGNSPADAEQLADAVHEQRRRGPVFNFFDYLRPSGPFAGRPPAERGPTNLEGSSLATAFATRDLEVGGAQARRAQASAQQDLVVRVFPAAIGWLSGGEASKLLGDWIRKSVAKELDPRLAAFGPQQRDLSLRINEAERSWLKLLADAAEIEVALDLGEREEITLAVRMRPRPGTRLATLAAGLQPAEWRESWLSRGDPIAIGAIHRSLVLPGQRAEAELWAGAKGRGAAAHLRFLDLQEQVLDGPCVFVLHSPQGRLGFDAFTPLRAGVDHAAAFSTYVDATRGGADGAIRALKSGTTPPATAITVEGEVLRVSARPTGPLASGPLGPLMMALWGSHSIDTITTFVGDGLVVTGGPGAEERLAALKGSKPIPPAPAAQAALAAARGSHSFVYVDLIALAVPFLRAMPVAPGTTNPIAAIPGLVQQPLPVLATLQGGSDLTARIAIPLSALANLASFLQPFLGRGTLQQPAPLPP